MKNISTLKIIGIVVTIVFCFIEMKAQDTTITSVPVPVGTSPDTIPPPPPPATTTQDTIPPAKEKKDGFNSRTRFGIRGGVIISKQDFESSSVSEDPQSKFGLDLAILASIPIGSGFFTFQPELHWLQKGYKIEDAVNGNITSTLNYVELPLLIRINFGGSLRLFAFTGPSAGYLINGTYEDNNGSQDATEFLDELELSAHLGAGVGIGTLEFDLRYMAGLSDISDSPTFTEVKNSSYGAGLTIKF